MHCIQLPPSQGYKYVSVMISMFSLCVETFSCCKATASAVNELLLEIIFPTYGIPSEFHSDQGTHFTGQIIQSVCKIWPTSVVLIIPSSLIL